MIVSLFYDCLLKQFIFLVIANLSATILQEKFQTSWQKIALDGRIGSPTLCRSGAPGQYIDV